MFKRNQTLRYGAVLSLLGSTFLAPCAQAAGTLTPLYNFGNTATDGENPLAGLIIGSDGNFYGTTEYGGANGDGAIYKITPSGTLTTIIPSTAVQTERTPTQRWLKAAMATSTAWLKTAAPIPMARSSRSLRAAFSRYFIPLVPEAMARSRMEA